MERPKSKKAMINAVLIFIIIAITFVISNLTNKADAVFDTDFDWNLADHALNNTSAFLSEDTFAIYGTGPKLEYSSTTGSPGFTYNRLTAECIGHNNNPAGTSGVYYIGAVVDIDNPNGYGTEHTGVNITLPNGQTHHFGTTDPLSKRGRFVAWLIDYGQNSGAFTDTYYGNGSIGINQNHYDYYISLNIGCFARYAGGLLDTFAGEGDQQPPKGQGWQFSSNEFDDYKANGIYDKAYNYAHNFQASGLAASDSAGEPIIEYTETQSILGPYKVKKEGGATITRVEITEKNGTKHNATILDSSGNVISANSIANETPFYLRVDKIITEISTIYLYGTGTGVKETRLVLLDTPNGQRLAINASANGNANMSVKLTVPPAKPIFVEYKYIKSVSRKQNDGTYKTLFTVPESDIPKLTVENKGKQSAKVSSVTYPDYSKYTDTNSSGQPILFDGDKIEYAWVIYNIGPGNSAPGTTRKLTDKPDKGLVVDNINGWTQDGSNYTKTITLSKSLVGFRGTATTPAYYTGTDTTITFRTDMHSVPNIKQEPIILKNNNTNPGEFHPPVLVAYKYIKSIQRLELDGSYTTVFTVPESDKPKITVENVGRNDAYVSNVTYPDYSKYTEEENGGVPIIYDGDKVQYDWVIYNIGPGDSMPGDTYTLVDKPEAGLLLDQANGWTDKGNRTYEKTITLSKSLPALTSANNSPAYHTGTDTRIYLKADIKDKVNNSPNTGIIKNNDTVPVDMRLMISGVLFLDHTTDKPNEENGYLDSGDEMLPEYRVILYDNGTATRETETNNEGYYEFDNLDITHTYYVSFEYNGQAYEPTTYDCKATSDITKKSYGTDGVQNRQNFNKKFENVNGSTNFPDWSNENGIKEFIIYAYTGPNGQGSRTYTAKEETETLRNINFGIKEREKFDFNLRKDLVNVELRINGKSHTYDYPGGDLPLDVNIRGTDIPNYERMIRKEDLAYRGNDKLEIYITYVLQIQNESVGQITGYVTDLNDYYDSSYTYVDSWDENNKQINWTQSGNVTGNGVTYGKMHTTDLANVGITDKKHVYVRFRVKDETIEELTDTERMTTEDNLAEIAAYRNTYTNDRYDKNNNKISSAGEVAGLLDIDSKPDNMDPVSTTVQNFLKESRTDEYQNLEGEEKTKRSRAVFEDDAESAPGLNIIPGEPRTISGVVFEDLPDPDKLKDDNERIGNGNLDTEDAKVNQVQVEMIEIGENKDDVNDYYPSNDNIGVDGGHLSDIVVRTNDRGEYTITGYIPGDYILRFTYGDEDCLKADQDTGEMYTGQDYKSTLYFEENYEGEDNYWYAETTPRTNDATDNQSRREEVNSYSRTLQYSNATILDSDRNSGNVPTLAEKTYMFADTATMDIEVEYTGDEKAEYDVTNVDFGIIERPRTKIVLHKNVGNVRLLATDGNTIFDSGATAPGLTWVPNTYKPDRELDVQGLVEGTVDEALLYGATAQISYTYTITNESEIDYNDVNYYVRGEKPADSKLNKMNVNKIIDYIPNILEYHDEYTNRTGEIIINTSGAVRDKDGNVVGSATAKVKETDKKMWDVKKTRGATLSEAEYRVSGNELLGEQVYKDVNQYIDQVVQFPSSDNYPSDITGAINSDPTKSKGILEPSGQIELRNVLTLSRVISRDEDLAGDENATNVPDENVAEIIQVTIDNGRRPYYEATRDDASGNPQTLLITETPGNANPVDETTLLEVDTAISEEVHFIVPFGQNRQLTIIIATIIGLGILVIGVIIIKKKVLLK